jgi:hypothetical protein
MPVNMIDQKLLYSPERRWLFHTHPFCGTILFCELCAFAVQPLFQNDPDMLFQQ